MESIPTKSTGDTYTAPEFNSSNDELKNLITNSGQTLSGSNPDQIGEAVGRNASGGANFYVISGTANALLFGTTGEDFVHPKEYFEGMEAEGVIVSDNTGAVTANVNGIGVLDVADFDGNALTSGDLVTGNLLKLRYNSSNDELRVSGKISTVDIADEAITADKLASNSVTLDKMADDSVDTDELVDDAVTNDKVANDAIDTPQIADDAVTQDNVNAAAIGQGQLKNAAQEVSVVSGSASVFTPTGGDFMLGTAFKGASATSGQRITFCDLIDSYVDSSNSEVLLATPVTTSLVAKKVFVNSSSISSITITAALRYIQSSPPYDIGDGECQSFIFAVVNSKGVIECISISPDPCWAYNGPTNVRSEYARNGKKYKKNCIIDAEKDLEDPTRFSLVEQEITTAYKNSDMSIIPHPFIGTDLTNKTVVLIDPCDDIAAHVELMKGGGETPGDELFMQEYVTIGNEHISGRSTPHKDILVVKPSWKNSKS